MPSARLRSIHHHRQVTKKDSLNDVGSLTLLTTDSEVCMLYGYGVVDPRLSPRHAATASLAAGTKLLPVISATSTRNLNVCTRHFVLLYTTKYEKVLVRQRLCSTTSHRLTLPPPPPLLAGT